MHNLINDFFFFLFLLQGRKLQFDYRFKREWKVEYPGCDMFRAGNHEYEYGSGAESTGMI